MSIQSKKDWAKVEAKARQHEAGLNLVKVEVEDRQRGAIIAAMAQIKAGQNLKAWETLNEGLKL